MLKRLFDFFFALLSLLIVGPLIFISFVFASWDTQSLGLFFQQRIGKNGKSFTIYKIKTLRDTTKTTSRFGIFLRKTKLDELPQLFNILNGTMSFVGPRPDIAGYADVLQGADRVVLKVRPGITGIASLKYRNEEALLKQQANPLLYNDTVIWPDKVQINAWYVENQSFLLDLKILFYTFLGCTFPHASGFQGRKR